MVGLIIFGCFWALVGLWAMLANIERRPRVWGAAAGGDWFQHACTLILGPIGMALVLDMGGRLLFWKKSRDEESAEAATLLTQKERKELEEAFEFMSRYELESDVESRSTWMAMDASGEYFKVEDVLAALRNAGVEVKP